MSATYRQRKVQTATRMNLQISLVSNQCQKACFFQTSVPHELTCSDICFHAVTSFCAVTCFRAVTCVFDVTCVSTLAGGHYCARYGNHCHSVRQDLCFQTSPPSPCTYVAIPCMQRIQIDRFGGNKCRDMHVHDTAPIPSNACPNRNLTVTSPPIKSGDFPWLVPGFCALRHRQE